MNEETLKQFEKLLLSKTRTATFSDLQEVAMSFFEVVKQMRVELEKNIEKTNSIISDNKDEYKSEMEHMDTCMSDMESELKDMLNESKTYSKDEIEKAYNDLMGKINALKDIMPTMPDLTSYSSKIEQIFNRLESMENETPEEMTPEAIRDKLESISVEEEKQKIESIGYLREELDKISKKIDSLGSIGSRPLFGGRSLRMSAFSFSGDGVTTSFSLPDVPGAKGLAIWAYYEGQYLHLNSQYTVANKTFACTGWTPDNGTVITGYLIS